MSNKKTEPIVKEVIKERNRLETMGLTATLGSFVNFNSSSRIQMLSSHVGQAIAPAKSDIPRTLTGFESQLADFTFKVEMPVDGIVKSIHRKYEPGLGYNSIRGNPKTTIIYQNNDDYTFDYIDVVEFDVRHPTFTSRYIINPLVGRLRPGSCIKAGTILAHSPNVKEGEIYATGMEASVAYLSVPAVIEDGFVISDEFAERSSPLEIGSSVASWGKRVYPVNLYGDAENYKPFPDIGDKIREDGLVFALREYDSKFDAIKRTPRALMEVDFISDRCMYGIPGAEVYDIHAETGRAEGRPKPVTPSGMETQAMKYINSASKYYAGILNTYDQAVKEMRRGIVISPELQNLVTRSIADQPNSPKAKAGRNSGIIRRTIKNTPLDEYRVEVKYFKRKEVQPGAKMTDKHGGI